jgi:FKBP-type peptidyl-prolyl cis-trans isomerase (trigger factor)
MRYAIPNSSKYLALRFRPGKLPLALVSQRFHVSLHGWTGKQYLAVHFYATIRRDS